MKNWEMLEWGERFNEQYGSTWLRTVTLRADSCPVILKLRVMPAMFPPMILSMYTVLKARLSALYRWIRYGNLSLKPHSHNERVG